MNIILIGSGHVASILGRRMMDAGHCITHCWSRNPDHGAALARSLNATLLPGKWNKWPAGSQLVLVSVSDDAYRVIAGRLPPTEMLVLHSGGAVPGNVLAEVSHRTGVLYPLQSLRKETAHIPDLPLLIDAANAADFLLLEDFARTLSPQVTRAGDEARMKYHVAAVFSANFANHIFALTESFCKKEGIDFAFLRPLLEETISRMRSASPGELQTGPAARGDNGTIEKHLLLLKNEPGMTAIYTLLTKSIIDFYS